MVTMSPSPKSALEHEVRRARDAGSTTGELLRLVRTGRASTRADLGRLTGLSRTAVASRLAALHAAGLLRAGLSFAFLLLGQPLTVAWALRRTRVRC